MGDKYHEIMRFDIIGAVIFPDGIYLHIFKPFHF